MKLLTPTERMRPNLDSRGGVCSPAAELAQDRDFPLTLVGSPARQ